MCHQFTCIAYSISNFDHCITESPQGCIELLDRSGVIIEGKEAVVIGRSNMVGIPVALLLMQRNATVTIAHSRTKDIAETVRRADIVIAAVGRAEMVKGRYVNCFYYCSLCFCLFYCFSCILLYSERIVVVSKHRTPNCCI